MLTVKDGPGFYRGPSIPGGNGAIRRYPSKAKGTNEFPTALETKFRQIRPAEPALAGEAGHDCTDFKKFKV
jgi:hypothetical protein